jgi:hypothetical protein
MVEQRSWNGTDVAVKLNGMDACDVAALMREVALYEVLLVRPHPHVVQVLGICTDAWDGKVRLVMRLCAKGSLDGVLVQARAKVRGWRCTGRGGGGVAVDRRGGGVRGCR